LGIPSRAGLFLRLLTAHELLNYWTTLGRASGKKDRKRRACKKCFAARGAYDVKGVAVAQVLQGNAARGRGSRRRFLHRSDKFVFVRRAHVGADRWGGAKFATDGAAGNSSRQAKTDGIFSTNKILSDARRCATRVAIFTKGEKLGPPPVVWAAGGWKDLNATSQGKV